MTRPDTSRDMDPEIHADKFDPSTGGYTVTWEKFLAVCAERDALQAKVGALHSAQSYTYIGKDGRPVLARDLEDQRDAAYTAGFEAYREMAIDRVGEIERHWDGSYRHNGNGYSDGTFAAEAALRAIKPQQEDTPNDPL